MLDHYGEDDHTREIMKALFEEANTKSEPRYVLFWFTDSDGREVQRRVHEPIAVIESEFVGRMARTQVGVAVVGTVNTAPMKLQLETCHDEETLRVVTSWMYGFNLNEDKQEEPTSIGSAVKIMRVASYLDMPVLLAHCNDCIACWARSIGSDVSDEDLRHCAELWRMFSDTSIEGPANLVRVALMRMLMQRALDDPVLVDFVSGCSLESLAVISSGVSCAARSVDLALAWWEHSCHNGGRESVLGHIPLEALPTCYLERLHESGRLSALTGDARRVQQCLERSTRSTRAKRSKQASEIPKIGWAGLFGSKLRTVDSNLSATGAAVVREIGSTGIHEEVEGSRGTRQAVVMAGSVFLFGTDQGLFDHTGYVYSTFDPEKTWRPFGIVPRSMLGGQYGTAVYRTWIVFVRMTGAGPLCAAFDVAKCTWLEMPGMTAREFPCIAVLGDSLYAIGGEPAAPTERIRLDQCLGGHGPLSCQWEQVGMTIERNRSTAVVVEDDDIYVSGGYFRDPARPAGTWSVSSALTRLSPSVRLVEDMRPMASYRYGHGSFLSGDGQIVVLGGAIRQQFRVRPQQAERFDFAPRERTWYPLELPADPAGIDWDSE
jgi:hypothetical protein